MFELDLLKVVVYTEIRLNMDILFTVSQTFLTMFENFKLPILMYYLFIVLVINKILCGL